MIVGLDPLPAGEPVGEFYRNGRLIDLDRAARVRSITLDWPRRLDLAFDVTLEHVSPEGTLLADGVVLSFRELGRVLLHDKADGHDDLLARMWSFVHAPAPEGMTLFDVDVREAGIVVVARDLYVDVEGEREPGTEATR